MNLVLPDRYALDADPLLGEGGMGRVLRARDRVLETPVALKIVRPDLAADVRFRKLFDLEVRISARFTHPHIVPLHDHGELPDGTPFLGLALADAGSFAILRDDCPPWEELLRLTLELLDALSHLHARDVLHRDLKPENVLLYSGDEARHVWLADLGLANAGSTLARKKGRMEGTPGFMSPEQHQGRPREYGPWTDLYSVGVMLWELVSGARPFDDDQTAATAALPPLMVREGMAVPSDLDLVLQNLLAPEPLSRYDLAADLRAELLALGPADRHAGDPTPVFRSTVRRTVAPSAPSLTAESEAPTEEAGDDALAEVAAASPISVVPWNRPFPSEIPATPEVEPGFGATARASLRLFALRELPLVAREEVRQELWDHAHAVRREGRSRVVLVVGEAGSGKSRLVDSVTLALEEGGWAESVLLSYERPPGTEDGYAGAARALIRPWNESRSSLITRMTRRIARERGRVDHEIREEAETLARWCGLLEEDEEPVAAGHGLREVYRHLEARAWRGLSCLVIDDAQWAVEEGDGLAIAEAVLHRAAEGAGGGHLLVIACVRAEDLHRGGVLAPRVAALVEHGAHRIDLPRLDRAGTEALLRECLLLAPELRSKVAERCEGNPLFARQLLLEWADRGWLVDSGGLEYGLAPSVDADEILPSDAMDLFRDRVTSLCEASGNGKRFRDAVHMAALAGLTIPRVVLELLVGREMAEFALGCGLWLQRDDLVRFDSTLLHQAVREQARARRDVSYLHRRLGRAWARYSEESGERADLQIGRHASAGRDLAFALEHLLIAAERAWTRGRSQELEEASRLGWEIVQEGPQYAPRMGEAAYWRARAHQVTGDAVRAHALYQKARNAADDAGDGAALVRALLGMGWAQLQLGDLEASEWLYGDAVVRAQQLGDRHGEASGIVGKALVEQQKRNFGGATILFTRVLNRLAQLDDARALGEATLGQALVARRTGAFDEAEELYTEAVEVFEEADDPLGAARAHLGHAILERQRGAFSHSEELLQKSLQISEELGATAILMEARLGMAELRRQQGEHDVAGRSYHAALVWAQRQRVFEWAIFAHLGQALIALEHGDLDAAYDAASRAAHYLEAVPGHWLWAKYRLVVATLLALRGDHTSTWQWLWSAHELGLGDTVDLDSGWCLEQICGVSAERGWANVIRVAGKLGQEQLIRLGDRDRARAIGQQLRAVLSP